MDDWPRDDEDGTWIGLKQVDASSWALLLSGNLAHIYYKLNNL